MNNQNNIEDSTGSLSFSQKGVQTATFGMGCFWSPESLFGHLRGVVRTRVGYAGGTSLNPTYHQIGDHTETIEIDFDPEIITLEEILDVFWSNHNPININDYKGRQYRSLLLYHDDFQQEIIHHVIKKRQEQKKGAPATEIAPYSVFTVAEDRHQKYYLKRYPNAIEKLTILYPSQEDLVSSTLAARLNGLAKGYINLEHITNEMGEWTISSSHREMMIDLIKQIRW
ncbi:peptide-methionine (S)-S-oxide reductase MsrA [Paenibacillus sp. IHBB 10380]|uniref:peptide-methionine (S)-S-oxide reductase MsrA n=1 Tax=Paenibacillus sp. IHBB 10380 TaxID=1566358 RepID=UPI0005CFDBC2|nr:peptide-methionine (S)-S-oxide reductase MsrA [Paenibacillus sp. IHBB 10380]